MLLLGLLAFATPVVTGDFDRDGIPDRAILRIEGARQEIVVQRGSGGEAIVYSGIYSDSAHGTLYLTSLPAGSYATACAKGLGRERPCPAEPVRATGDILQFGTPESSQAVALWERDRFRVVWLSD